MRHILLAISLAALTACSPAPGADQAMAPPVGPAGVAPAQSAGVDGWEIDMTAYGQIGTTLPAFTAKLADGKEITADALRGHWTILGVWPDTAPPDEDRFAQALNSAVDQDPALDLLIIHPAPAAGAAPSAHPWPMLIDDGKLASALTAPSLPAYLLVGPDLTIEGYRGALTTTPDDGIKSVIRGVAEIRKQIAAPE